MTLCETRNIYFEQKQTGVPYCVTKVLINSTTKTLSAYYIKKISQFSKITKSNIEQNIVIC